MIRLSRSFKPTHLTAGLDGYPAVDEFGKPGEAVEASFAGKVRRKSGKSPAQGGKPGGAYGWSIYVACDNGDDRYLTHFSVLDVKVGDRVKHGTQLGRICDATVSSKPASSSHIHHGLKKAKNPPKPPPARLYHVHDYDEGKMRASRKTAAQIGRSIEKLERRFGPLIVSRADQPNPKGDR